MSNIAAPLDDLIHSFAGFISDGTTDLYNEFSFQHELGIFLRERLKNHKIQFERNVSYFFRKKEDFLKKEIDIVAYSGDKKSLDFTIELKYPRNGQYPEQMFSFCKDIAFLEQLKESGFAGAALVILAEDRPFYSGSGEGIYGFFRSEKPLKGRIQKPTGKRDAEVFIKGSYVVKWKPITEKLKYALVEVS